MAATAVKHAGGPQDYTLCGLAFDADQSGDWPEPILHAKPGEYVTCKECKAHIDFVHAAFRPQSYMQRNV